MAGSFNIFRQYQKSALAALAIMAMLAFFVLPPLLQMNSGGGGGGDPLAVAWSGGGLRENDLRRQVFLRRAVNQFLMSLQVAATGDPRVRPPLPDDERSVVETLLLADEAKANGLVVSDAVVNDVIKRVSGDMVPPDQIAAIIGELRSRVGVTEADVFDALRTLVAAERLERLVVRGADFPALPPGWRWDAFRRLEQGATVEVVPVAVESLVEKTGKPTDAQLEEFYAANRDRLPNERSARPGFREPARARYEGVVARTGLFVAEAAAAVTDEQIAKFYEENKDRLYRKQPDAAAPGGDAAATPGAGATSPEAPMPEVKPEAAAETKPAETKPETPAAEPAKPPEPKPEPSPEPKPDAVPPSVSMDRGSVRLASFRQPAGEAATEVPPASPPPAPAGEPSPATPAGPPAPPVAPATPPAPPPPTTPAPPPPPTTPASSAPAAGSPDAGAASPAPPTAPPQPPATPPVEYDPLDKVRDDVRKRLSEEAAAAKVQAALDAVGRRIGRYSEDLDMAIAMEQPVPAVPDLAAIAAEQGLDPVKSDFVSMAEAVAAGGIGGSFDFAFSPEFGIRQQSWVETVLAPGAPAWRPFATRDTDGNRYLSWKTEERPEFSPPLADIRDRVERAWRLEQARPLAREQAAKVADAAAGKPLAAAVAGQADLTAASVGPFTWLTRGTAPFGSAPMLSQPDGLAMPGEAFMEAVFALEPGGTAVAFNEPQTVCYAIRLSGLEPPRDVLEARFLDAATDPRRLAILAADTTQAVRDRWLDEILARRGVEWKRPPR